MSEKCKSCIDGEFPCHKYNKGLKCYQPALDKQETKSAEKLKGKAIDNYIKEKHTQEECVGFIDGYKQAMQEFSKVSIDWDKLEDLFYKDWYNPIGTVQLGKKQIFNWFKQQINDYLNNNKK